MLIISFDSIGDSEYETLLKYPAFNAFAKQCAVFRGVSTVFLSNTYPVHTSVATGVLPHIHGVTSNTQPFPAASPSSQLSIWNCNENIIKAKTIWQAASRKGIKTAAVLWPVTAFSKTINYNMPEIRARPGKSQVLTSLKAGSVFLQLKLFLRHKKLMDGINQPNLDFFSTACMADILREKKPGLSLVHLTAYDSLCHEIGKGNPALEAIFMAMDKNLSVLLDAAGDDDIILFSDHSQINIHTVIDPNLELVNKKLIRQTDNGYLPGGSSCFFELCGGSAFFHAGSLNEDEIEKIRSCIKNSEGFNRFLTPGEINEAGITNTAFGFCAKAGYCYEIFGTEKKGNHGYPLDMNDYSVFYMVRGCGLKAGSVTQGGSLLDIAPLAAKQLDISL
ncbi:MAG: alkaline phosphatase family protein [Treponema sp.]|jgi:predicted AlkP superfamily pyrophosphatase or phosphodiesterase|nr:alkaline phosphatase family protein [Treponema sp.]